MPSDSVDGEEKLVNKVTAKDGQHSNTDHEAPNASMPAHMFVELTSLVELSFPTSSSRIKYTCLDASSHYLAVGSTSGTVYLFSRYASKYRNRLSSVPLQVISTKDGSVLKLAISKDEKYLACACQRGPLIICALSALGHSPSALITNLCHTGTDEAGQLNHVTELCWSEDSKKVYAGDTKGHVSCTRIQSRNLFRSPCEILLEADSEIVQIDVCEDSLLVATITRSCLCDLRTLSCTQVGKKLRHGHFGAVFYPLKGIRRTKVCISSDDAASAIVEGSSSTSQIIFACRPNGRLWEANGQGVVYRTHHFKNIDKSMLLPVASFKGDFIVENISREQSIGNLNFGRIDLIDCENNRFLLAKGKSSFYVIDPSDGRLVLVCEFENEEAHPDFNVFEHAVCGSDIFMLSNKTGELRKLSLFTLYKAIEKLHWRNCFVQAAQVIYNCFAYINCLEFLPWKLELIDDIMKNVRQQASLFPRKDLNSAHVECLQRLLDICASQSHLNPTDEMSQKERTAVCRFKTGIHSVVRVMDNSGYDDDFTFRAPSPLRVRSKSTPNMDGSTVKTMIWKRRSLPLKRTTGDNSVLEENDEEEALIDDQRKQLVEKAFQLLEDAEMSKKCILRSGSAESLRTLLGCDRRSLAFDSQVTLGDVPKELAAAKKLLKIIADPNEKEKRDLHSDRFPFERIESTSTNLNTDFTSLFGRKDPLEDLFGFPVQIIPRSIVNVDRRITTKTKSKGARIVKAIKPSGKAFSGAIESAVSTEILEPPSGAVVNKSYEKTVAANNVNRSNLAVAISNESDNCSYDPESENSNFDSSDLKSVTEKNVINESLNNAKDAEESCDEKIKCQPNYIVEKNFVPEKIKLSWRAPSETELSITGHEEEDADERRMEASQLTAAPSTPSPDADTQSSHDQCEKCFMHVSWRIVMVFGPVMSQLKVISDNFEKGGVPTSLAQWEQLFSVYLHQTGSTGSQFNETAASRSRPLCEECSSFFSFGKRIEKKMSWLRDIPVRARQNEWEEKPAESGVRQTALSWQEPVLRRLFFTSRPDSDSKVALSNQSSTPEGVSKPVGEEVDLNNRNGGNEVETQKTKEKEIPQYLDHFPYFGSLRLSQLLYCMRLCEGIDVMFDFLKTHEYLISHLTSEDWQNLIALKSSESDRWKEIMPRQIVCETLSELNINSVKDVGIDASELPNESPRRCSSLKQQSLHSFVISVDGNCPCCTLPLRTRVSDTECYITSFHCGHSYHKVCLREAKLMRCIRCEVERKRQRQQQQIGPSAPGFPRRHTSNSSPQANVPNARHIPVRAARVNVTMPTVTPKVMRRK